MKIFGCSPPRLSWGDPLTSCPNPSIPPFSQYFISHQPFGKSGCPVCRLRAQAKSKGLGQGRKRGAGSWVPGLSPSLSYNRKCLGILRIRNAQRVQIKLYFRHECTERGQAVRSTLTAPGRRDKVGKNSWIKGGKHPQIYRPLSKPSQRFQAQLCSHKVDILGAVGEAAERLMAEGGRALFRGLTAPPAGPRPPRPRRRRPTRPGGARASARQPAAR